MPPPAADPEPGAGERRPSAWTAYIHNHSSNAAADSTSPPPSTAPALPSPSKPWFSSRRPSASAVQDSTSSPTRQVFSSATPQHRDASGPVDLSRQAHSHSPPLSPASPFDDMAPTTSFYPKPSSVPLTDVPPPIMPPPIRSGRPFLDPEEAAAERARRADEHRIKMRERKESQAVEALMHRQEQRMSRRSAKKPTKFVPKGNDIPPVPDLPERDNLFPPAQADIDDQGRRTTLETNLDDLIAENTVAFPTQHDSDGSDHGSITGSQRGARQTASQAPSFPILDALSSGPGAPARTSSYSSNKDGESRNDYRLSAAISLKGADGAGSSYVPGDDSEASPLDSAFDLGRATPTTAEGRPTSTFLSPNDAQARTLRREKSISSTYLRRSIIDSETELLPDDGKSRDATELFKYEEELGPAKRTSVMSRAPSSNRNTRTVSILKYTDYQPPNGEPPAQKEATPTVTFHGEGLDGLAEESMYDADSEFVTFEDLTLTRRLAHLCMIFPYAILGMLVRYGLNILFTYDGHSISALLWSQGISAAVFGLVLGKREDLTTLYPPIWTGVSVGFAGSINSFSGWMLQTFLAFSNFAGYNRGAFQDILDGFSQLAVTLVVAHGAMSFGIHCARHLPSLPSAWRTSPSRFSPTPRADIFAIALSVAAYVVAIISYSFFGSATIWRNELIFPMILAPGGAVVRYYLSRLNATREPLGRINGIPLGTLIANLVGTAVLAACYILMRLDLKSSITSSQCAALNSLSFGFAGTMTNLAALVFEARAVWQTHRWRWAYVVGSIAGGQVLFVAIFGGLWWGGGSVSEVCSMR